MATASDLREIERIKENANMMGFKVVCSKSHHSLLALVPTDHLLVLYTAGAELSVGDTNDLQSFLNGWSAASTYYSGLGLVSASKIKNAEDKYMQKRTFSALKSLKDENKKE